MPRLSRTAKIITLLTIFLNATVILSGLPYHRSVEIGQITPDSGHSFIATVPSLPFPAGIFYHFRSDRMGRQSSPLTLLENATPLGPGHAIHADIRAHGAGRYSYWDGQLYFSTSDGSDPRSNGRRYVASAPYHVKSTVLKALLLADTSLLLFLGMVLLQSRGWRFIADLVKKRGVAYAEALAIPATVSAIVFTFSPFFWVGSDSTTLVVFGSNYFPHFPPLYLVTIDAFTALFGISRTGIVALALFQHLLLALAITYAAASQQKRWRRLAFSAALTLGTSFNVISQAVLTESVAVPMLIVCLGALVRMHDEHAGKGPSIVFFIAVVLGALARHVFIAFGVMAPAYFAVRWLMQPSRYWGVRTLSALLLLPASYVAGSFSQTLYGHLLEINAVSIVGRPGVYRMHETWSRMPPDQRDAWAQRLIERADTPDVAMATSIMLRNPTPWLGSLTEIKTELQIDNEAADLVASKAFANFLTFFDGAVLSQQWINFERFFLSSPNLYNRGKKIPGWLLQNTGKGLRKLFADPQSREVLIKVGERPDGHDGDGKPANAFGVLKAAVSMVESCNPTYLLLASLVFGIAHTLRGGRPGIVPVIGAIVIGAVAYAASCSLVTITIVRYLMPIQVLAWASLGLSLCALFDPGRRLADSAKSPDVIPAGA